MQVEGEPVRLVRKRRRFHNARELRQHFDETGFTSSLSNSSPRSGRQGLRGQIQVGKAASACRITDLVRACAY